MCGSGWVKIYRRLWNKKEWSANMKIVFLFLVCDANFVDDEMRRGVTKTSESKIAEYVGLTKRQVGTALKNLAKDGAISVDASGKGSVIEVKNYGIYQGEKVSRDLSHDLSHDGDGDYEVIPYIEKDAPENVSHDLASGVSTHKNNKELKEKELKENNTPNGVLKEKSRFVKPSLEEIVKYCYERNNHIDAERFYNYYESNGWKVGSNAMKDWRAAVRTWECKQREEKKEEHLF